MHNYQTGCSSSRMSRVDRSWTPKWVRYHDMVDDLLGRIGAYVKKYTFFLAGHPSAVPSSPKAESCTILCIGDAAPS